MAQFETAQILPEDWIRLREEMERKEERDKKREKSAAKKESEKEEVIDSSEESGEGVKRKDVKEKEVRKERGPAIASIDSEEKNRPDEKVEMILEKSAAMKRRREEGSEECSEGVRRRDAKMKEVRKKEASKRNAKEEKQRDRAIAGFLIDNKGRNRPDKEILEKERSGLEELITKDVIRSMMGEGERGIKPGDGSSGPESLSGTIKKEKMPGFNHQRRTGELTAGFLMDSEMAEKERAEKETKMGAEAERIVNEEKVAAERRAKEEKERIKKKVRVGAEREAKTRGDDETKERDEAKRRAQEDEAEMKAQEDNAKRNAQKGQHANEEAKGQGGVEGDVAKENSQSGAAEKEGEDFAMDEKQREEKALQKKDAELASDAAENLVSFGEKAGKDGEKGLRIAGELMSAKSTAVLLNLRTAEFFPRANDKIRRDLGISIMGGDDEFDPIS